MAYKRSLFCWVLASAPLLLALGVTALCFDSGYDLAQYFRVHRYQHPDLKAFFTFVTDWLNPSMYAVYAALLFWAWEKGDDVTRRFIFLFLLLQFLTAFLLVHFLKFSIGRPRPWIDGEWNSGIPRPMEFSNQYNSFPSGHTTEITGSSMALALRYGALGRFLLALGLGIVIALVGYSRIYLGKHHPSDVFFGWFIGSVSGWLVLLLTTEFTKNRSNNA